MNQEEKRKIRRVLRVLQYLVLSLDHIRHHVNTAGADYGALLAAFDRRSDFWRRAAGVREDLTSFFDDIAADGESFSPYEKMLFHVGYWRWPGVSENDIEQYGFDDVQSLNIPSVEPGKEELFQASCFVEMVVVSLDRIGSCMEDPDVDEEEITLRFYEDFDIYRRAVEARDGLSSYFDARVLPGEKKSELQRALAGVRSWRVPNDL